MYAMSTKKKYSQKAYSNNIGRRTAQNGVLFIKYKLI
jgi:hypothetical protein